MFKEKKEGTKKHFRKKEKIIQIFKESRNNYGLRKINVE